MKTKKFICPNCGHKQKFYHTITALSFTKWKCHNCGSIIKLDTSISVPTSVALALVFYIILNRVDPPIWVGCLFFVIYSACALIFFYKSVKLKLVNYEDKKN